MSFIRLINGVKSTFTLLDGNGKLLASLMPTGIGADTASMEAFEAIAAGDFVNVFNDGGTPKIRLADASSVGKPAHGFVLAAVASGANGDVYFEGNNGQLTGLTAGTIYLSAASPGKVVSTAPSTTGQVVQSLGVATSATNANVEISDPIELG